MIDAKRYFEENGFDEGLYKKNFTEQHLFWVENRCEYPEEMVVKNLKKLHRIRTEENIGLFWKIEGERIFNVFVEGYAATGEYSPARYLGTYKAESFKEACDKYIEEHPNSKDTYDGEKLSIWGCKLFNNMIDAQKFVG